MADDADSAQPSVMPAILRLARAERASRATVRHLASATEPMQRICGWILEHSLHNPDWKRKFKGACLTAVGIELLLYLVHGWTLLGALSNFAWDVSARLSLHGHPTDTPIAITFVDVDQESWQSKIWGAEPVIAPRQHLATLIRKAAKANTRYLVLDILLDNPSPDPTADRALRSTIEEAAKATRAHPQSGMHILFARSVRGPLRADRHATTCIEGRTPVMRRSQVDDLIRAYPDALHNMAPYYAPSQDGVVRAWRLWNSSCAFTQTDPTHSILRWTILPSPQLLVWLLNANDGKMPNGIAPLLAGDQNAASATKADDVFGAVLATVPASKAKPHSLPFAYLGKQIEDDGTDAPAESRIDYRFQDIPPASKMAMVNAIPALDALDEAHILLGRPNGLVLIGQTFPEAGDRHPTPIGNMAGSTIIINSMISLLRLGPISNPPWYLEIPYLLCEIAIVAAIMAFCQPWTKKLILVAVLLCWTIPVTIALLRHGIWLELGIPIFAIYVHNVFIDFEEYLDIKRHARAARRLARSNVAISTGD